MNKNIIKEFNPPMAERNEEHEEEKVVSG